MSKITDQAAAEAADLAAIGAQEDQIIAGIAALDAALVAALGNITGLTPDEQAAMDAVQAQIAALRVKTSGIDTSIPSGKPVLPLAPGGVSVVAAPGAVSLGWTAVPGATGYNVKRGSVTAGPYTTVNTAPVPTNSFTDSGLPSGVGVFYVISALNSVGESPNSGEISAMPA